MTTSRVLPTADTEASDARRSERYAARHHLWDRSSLRRVKACGRYTRADGVRVRVSTGADGSRSAGYAGLVTCGSVWACPVCSAKIAAHRQGEIATALTRWQGSGGRVALVTMTMRHRDGQRLADLWDSLSEAWQAALSGRSWKVDQETYGTPFARVVRTGRRAGETVVTPRIPVIRVVEVTHGSNGWHVHVHALFLLGAGVGQHDLDVIAGGLFTRWSNRLERLGMSRPSRAHGTDARLLEGDAAAALGEYFTKSVYRDPAESASFEVARGDLKDARGGNRSVFGLLRSLVHYWGTGDLDGQGPADRERDARLWREWEKASKGRRQIAWTPGLRALLLGDEDGPSDEDIADEDQGGEDVALVPTRVWRVIVAHRADWSLLAAWRASAEAGRAALDHWYDVATAHWSQYRE